MTVTVVIVWRESAELLRRCLLALQGQGADQVVVSPSSEAESSDGLRSEFPDVMWLARSGNPDLAELQWRALPAVSGDVVAFLEAPSIPGPGWIAAHRQAHQDHPGILACGGPVRPPQDASAWRRGWYWSDYAAYTTGRPSGPARDLTDANVSYQTSLLLNQASMLAEGVWGWRIRKASASPSFYEAAAYVDYPCPHTLRAAMRHRWATGRAHGCARDAGRILSIVGAPLLPLVLTWRGWRQAPHTDYLRVLPWVLLFHIWWTCGEIAGSAIGRR